MLKLKNVLAQLLQPQMEEIVLFLSCLRLNNIHFPLYLLVDRLKCSRSDFQISLVYKICFRADIGLLLQVSTRRAHLVKAVLQPPIDLLLLV